MKNMQEKIYDLLEKEENVISVEDIQKKLKIDDKKEVLKTLLVLKRQGAIYEKLVEGKPYYSTNESNGEGKNQIQKNMDNLVKAINDVPQDFSKKKDKTVKNKKDLLKFTYDKKQKYVGDKYTFDIPDSFKVIEEDGRDFVAYLPNEDAKDLEYNMGGASIIIYPSQETSIGNLGIASPITETKLAAYDLSFWKSIVIMFAKTLGMPDYFSVRLKNTEARCIVNSALDIHHYYFMCCVGNDFKQIHIQIDNMGLSEKELTEICINIMNGFNCELENKNQLDFKNKKYLAKDLGASTIKELEKELKRLNENLNKIFNYSLTAEATKYQMLRQFGVVTGNVDARKKIRKALKNYISLFESYFIYIEKIVREAHKNNIPEDKMARVYSYVKEIIDSNKKPFIDLGDNDLISEESKMANDFYNNFFKKEIKISDNYKENNDKDEKSKFLNLINNNISQDKLKWQKEIDNIKKTKQNLIKDYIKKIQPDKEKANYILKNKSSNKYLDKNIDRIQDNIRVIKNQIKLYNFSRYIFFFVIIFGVVMVTTSSGFEEFYVFIALFVAALIICTFYSNKLKKDLLEQEKILSEKKKISANGGMDDEEKEIKNKVSRYKENLEKEIVYPVSPRAVVNQFERFFTSQSSNDKNQLRNGKIKIDSKLDISFLKDCNKVSVVINDLTDKIEVKKLFEMQELKDLTPMRICQTLMYFNTCKYIGFEVEDKKLYLIKKNYSKE